MHTYLVSCAWNSLFKLWNWVCREQDARTELTLSEDEREQLLRWSRRAKSAQAFRIRAPELDGHSVKFLAGAPRRRTSTIGAE